MGVLNRKPKLKYYSLNNILEYKCQYNMIIGERSNGKTYAVLHHIIKEYFENGSQGAVIRRWYDDLKGKRGEAIFSALIANGEVSKLSNGKYNGIRYYSGKWYFTYSDGDGKPTSAEEPFCYGFALTQMEHDKSTSYPQVRNILFDECLTRNAYLPDEFVLFMNVLSTIIRQRDDVTIFMCGNTVNQYSPYFAEMGLTNIKQMKQGDIDIYTYGDSELRVAVEFADSPSKSGKPSDVYFAFNNSKLNMIKGVGGVWEMSIYPHLPYKYKPKEVVFMYFIQFDGETLQCEVIHTGKDLFTYIHRKTTEIKNPQKDLVYSPVYTPSANWKRRITAPSTNLEKKIYNQFVTDKVFYQDNTVGEIVRNYLQWSISESTVKK